MTLSKPLIIFDGDCGFCRRWIERWHEMTADAVDYAPYQEVGHQFPSVSSDEFRASVFLAMPDGKILRAAHAVLQALATQPSSLWPLWIYQHIPGATIFFELSYRVVADNRPFFSFLTHFFWGKSVRQATYHVSSNIFIRGMGLVYGIAFVSLGTQILGLVGSDGIVPAAEHLKNIASRVGSERFLLVPTLAWLNSSDLFIQGLCWIGAFFSFLAMMGIASGFLLFICWVFYISLIYIGSPFLSFQWDILLLEAGFLALFYANKKPGVIRILLKFLIFKLMFLSGWVKLASHDPTWRSLQALRYHYETQPLPPWTSWYLHQTPGWFHVFCCSCVLITELFVPFFIFFPRRIRHISAWTLISLQILIFLTGNYTFFNILTALLCLLLLDDFTWPKSWVLAKPSPIQKSRCLPWVAVALIAGSAFGLLRFTRPLFLYNSYGLFARMTTERPEIILEGSDDQVEWKAYEFRYKPGALDRVPAFVAPHQPRLDWQMWFAALGNYRQNPWLLGLCKRLLEGSPDVLQLLRHNPFPGHPPRYIRAVVYDYHFTSLTEKKASGQWWRRDLKGLYCPVLSLKGRSAD